MTELEEQGFQRWLEGPPEWTTADGTEMTFREMEDRHLVNVIRLVASRGAGIPERLLSEVNRRNLLDEDELMKLDREASAWVDMPNEWD